MDAQRTVPAVVAGADSPAGLAIAAGLQVEDVPVIGLAVDTGAPACRSAAWTAIRPVAGSDAASWLAALQAAHDRYGRFVLLIADDAAVRIVGRHRGEVDAVADVVLPDWADVALLLDKAEFQAWATGHGFPAPAVAAAGLDSDVWFCLTYRDRDGHEVLSHVGRTITRWPVGTGSSALAVTAEHPALHALTHRLLDAAGHVGFGSLEVRHSSHDGRIHIVGPTVGRPNLQTALATAAGVNLAVAAYRDALRRPQPAPAAPRAAVWVHETAFPLSLVVAGLRRRLDVAEVVAALARRATRTGAFAGERAPVRAEWRRLAGRLGRREGAAPAPAVRVPAPRTPVDADVPTRAAP